MAPMRLAPTPSAVSAVRASRTLPETPTEDAWVCRPWRNTHALNIAHKCHATPKKDSLLSYYYFNRD